MKRIIIAFFAGIIIPMSYYTIAILYPGKELFLLPFITVVFIVGLFGVVLIPIALFIILRKNPVKKWILVSIGVFFGMLLGMIWQQRINDWDSVQRNLSGQILSQELEDFRLDKGHYPDSLPQLDLNRINAKLPSHYQMERFIYSKNEIQYELGIPIPFFEKYKWNTELNKFE
jgi:hypothetical protein